MESILGPFQKANFSNIPPVRNFHARDETPLAYRHYPAQNGKSRGTVVLLHGSSTRNHSMHPLALGLSGAGWEAYALDVRGHGDSSARGNITYIGQLEDDLEDFMKSSNFREPKVLAGFSSGGGFALRFAGSTRQDLFDGYVLLSPFLHQDSATYRKNVNGWVGLGLPRLIALLLLNRFGFKALNHLPVLAFALAERDMNFMTPQYSFALWSNFRPHDDYRGDIRSAKRPMSVLAGIADEVVQSDKYSLEFNSKKSDVQITLVPELSHVGLILDPHGIHAIVQSMDRFQPLNQPRKILKNPIKYH